MPPLLCTLVRSVRFHYALRFESSAVCPRPSITWQTMSLEFSVAQHFPRALRNGQYQGEGKWGQAKKLYPEMPTYALACAEVFFTEPFGVWTSCKAVSHFLTCGIRLQAFGVQQCRVGIVGYIRSSFPSIASVEEPTGSNCGGSFYNVTFGPFSHTEQ